MKGKAVNTNENPWTAAEDAKVVELRIAGRTWAEIALIVDRPVAATQTRYYEARKRRDKAPRGDLYTDWAAACRNGARAVR